MRLSAYLRVSTDRQAEHGLGLDVQEQAIRGWARQHGHKITAWHTDAGVSGSNGLETRVALLDALGDVREKQSAGIVVARLDRLARDLIVQETILSEVRKLGGDVHTTSPAEAGYLADDPDDPSRKLIRQILGAVAEYERAMTVLRLRSGRRRKAEHGGFAYGSPPTGWRAAGGQLVEDEREQQALARIRQLRADGQSYRQIADALNAESIAPKRGPVWHAETVRRAAAR